MCEAWFWVRGAFLCPSVHISSSICSGALRVAYKCGQSCTFSPPVTSVSGYSSSSSDSPPLGYFRLLLLCFKYSQLVRCFRACWSFKLLIIRPSWCREEYLARVFLLEFHRVSFLFGSEEAIKVPEADIGVDSRIDWYVRTESAACWFFIGREESIRLELAT